VSKILKHYFAEDIPFGDRQNIFYGAQITKHVKTAEELPVNIFKNAVGTSDFSKVRRNYVIWIGHCHLFFSYTNNRTCCFVLL
jgi:hypothetical protein